MHYRFGEVELVVPQRQLRVAGVPASVGARAFDLLLALIERRERVVGKNELLDLVWPGVAVEENNVQVQISSLRRLLGPQAITTVPGRGYRFTALLQAAAAQPEPPAPRPPQTPRSPAPALPPLFGRDADLQQLGALLRAHRTVTLVAAGGVGKTHLARALAAAAPPAGADESCWVELAALGSAELVAPEVARALGFQLTAGQPALQTVVDVLRGRRGLLLLDNAEHVLRGVAALADALNTAAPQLQVLVTSQVPLAIPHERVYRLDTLALPQGAGLEAARASGALELLVHRIQAVMPRYTLTAANAPRLALLCQRLDGIPLALELAAARVPLLGLEGLLEHLGERLRVLGSATPTGLARHQTLRAALEFSHGLLNAAEQTVLRRLGVFAGSFSAALAQDVVADASMDRWAVLDHLGALVEKSMLIADDGDPPRLRLLETTHAYALERLAEAGETAAWQARHAQAVDALMDAAERDYWQLSDAAMLARYGPDHANLRAALDWSLVHAPARAITLAGNACGLWRESLGLQPEGARYCEAALARVDAATPPRAQGRLWATLAWMLIWSQQQRARSAAARAAEWLRQTDDAATLGMALLLLIPGTTRPDDRQEAVLAELRRLHDPLAPPRVRAQLLSASARYAMGAGRYDEASGLYEQARQLLQACGATQWAGVLAWTQAGIALTTGQVDVALPLLQDTSQRLAQAPGRGIFLAFAQGSLATAQLLRGDTAAARGALQAACSLILRYELGSRYAGTAACLAAQEGRWPAAAQLLGYGAAAARALGVDAEEPVEVRVRQQVREQLARHATPAQADEWAGVGALLSAEAAYGLALAPVSAA